MLSIAGEYLEEHNPEARLTMFGQELNDESYAICKADMLIKGQDVANIVAGNTLSEDGHPHTQVRLHALQSAVRRGMEKGRKRNPQGTRTARLQWPLRPRPAARLRWLAAVPAAPHQQDAPGGGRRQPLRHRAQRLAAVHRRRRHRAKAKSAAMCWKTTWWKPSSACPPTCSTTPASAPMSGYSPTASRNTAKARCN